MKRIILSALIAVLAIGASAFTNVEKVNRFVVIFYHNPSGTYTRNPVNPSCSTELTTACTITYNTSSLASFPDTAIPTGGTASSDKGYY